MLHRRRFSYVKENQTTAWIKSWPWLSECVPDHRTSRSNEIRDIKARRGGDIIEVKTFPGGMVNSGEVIIEAVDPATGAQTASSFFSAFLGTIAFSATTMLFWFRRTTLFEWILLAIGTCFLYWPTLLTDAVGIALVGFVIFMQIAKNKKEHGSALEPS